MRDDLQPPNPERDGSQIGESGDANEPEESDDLDDFARPSPGLIERLRRLTDGSARARKPLTKAELSQDRTRPLLLLIGGIVGAVLLFLGVFSTPPMRNSMTDSAQPNLGRRSSTGITGEGEQLASVIPLLSANVGGRASGNAQLSAEDILGTSTQSFEPDDQPEVADWREALVQAAPREVSTRSSIPDSNTVDETTRRDELPTFSYGNGASERTPDPSSTASLATSSIVFVRSTETANTPSRTSVPNSALTAPPALLPPGSRLIARLESAVTTALNAPVVAAIEYNYERDGVIVVPAGATAIGEIQQAAASGHIGITFHTLRMPDGRQESIRAIAMSLDHEPLEGEVSGENTVKKVLSRALSGIGTMAAYVVGAGGVGLNRPVNGGTLLRDRLATNIAQAGEQEFANAAYSENIVVTIPAQTRFYVVLEENALQEPSTRSTEDVRSAIGPGALPSAEELQELIDLKREIDRLYGSSLATPLGSQ